MERSVKLLLAVLGAAAAAGVGAGGVYLRYKDDIAFAEKYSLVQECENFLMDRGVDIPESGEDDADIANAYLSVFKDKYTYYYENDEDPVEYAEKWTNYMPTAVGSGFKIMYSENDELIFSSVTKDMPAYEAGLREGDKVIAINGNKFSGDYYGFSKQLLGKDGTMVDITVERDGKTIDITLVRKSGEDASQDGVTIEKMNDVLYIRLEHIEPFAGADLRKALDGNEYSSIVIDLRGNGGGDAGTALGMADNFISEGVVTLHSYTGRVTENTANADENDITGVPTVVLVNERTASAAEILTALMKQYYDATLVGTNTFGKGIYQLDGNLSNGGHIRYTAGYYTVGDWECYQGVGIAPDVEVEMDSSLIGTDEDVQLQKALEILD